MKATDNNGAPLHFRKARYRQAVLCGLAKHGAKGLPKQDHPYLHEPELDARELDADEDTRRGVAMLLAQLPKREGAPPEPVREPDPLFLDE